MPYINRNQRFKRGLCNHCPNPVKQPFKRCEKCLEVDRAKSRIRQSKARIVRDKENRCLKCGIDLHIDADKGLKNCITCREAEKWNSYLR